MSSLYTLLPHCHDVDLLRAGTGNVFFPLLLLDMIHQVAATDTRVTCTLPRPLSHSTTASVRSSMVTARCPRAHSRLPDWETPYQASTHFFGSRAGGCGKKNPNVISEGILKIATPCVKRHAWNHI